MSDIIRVEDRLPVDGQKVDCYVLNEGIFYRRDTLYSRYENVFYDNQECKWYYFRLKRDWFFQVIPKKEKVSIEEKVLYWSKMPDILNAKKQKFKWRV